MSEVKDHSSGPSTETVTTPINAVYTAAELRCVTRPVGDQLGIAFNREDGSIVRLKISVEHAMQIAHLISNQIDLTNRTATEILKLAVHRAEYHDANDLEMNFDREVDALVRLYGEIMEKLSVSKTTLD